jgi:hypothetical protein
MIKIMTMYLKNEHKFLIKNFNVKNNDHIFEKGTHILIKYFNIKNSYHIFEKGAQIFDKTF